MQADCTTITLFYSAPWLPTGATLTPQAQYGHALLNWTPSSSDIGVHDISVQVTDSGLGPQGAGYIQDPNAVLIPNAVAQTVRIIVRAANATPELLGVQINGTATTLTADATQVAAKEGVATTITLSARDTDQDWLNWTAATLPRGMHLDVQEGTGGNSNLVLSWTPDLFAAQDSNIIGGAPGHYRFSISASDGAASVVHTFEVTVANTNQAPQILPMPLQLVNEGETLSFTTLGVDADGDPLNLSLIHDSTTPTGVFYDPKTGYFEWTPSQDIVNNATATDTPYTFTFTANDGQATTVRTVQVRVFDVNRQPEISTSNHAVVVGQAISLPVVLGSSLNLEPRSSILVSDADGAAQTQALSISFVNLPEGASYDAQTHRLNWIPGPGQIGDYTMTVKAYDGLNTTSNTFTIRVVAEAAANAPKILLVSTTPSTPAQPGSTVVATIRAQGYSTIQTLSVQVRTISQSSVLDPQSWYCDH